MSWWVYLERDDEPVLVENHEEGGTYALGGVGRAELNVTYNYGGAFRSAWPTVIEGSGALVKMLDGRRAGDTIGDLESAVAKLGTTRSKDYWEPTHGNAGYALSILLSWAIRHPDAYWRVS